MTWANRNTRVHGQSKETPPLPEGRFSVISADPPWKYQNWTDKAHGAASAWYETMSTKDICSIPVTEAAADDSLLFLWVTNPKLEDGLQVMKAWGFDYVTVAFDWVKTYRRPVQIQLPNKGDVLDLCDRFCPEEDYAPFLEPSPVRSAWIVPGNLYCGLGFWARGGNELCILGKRGKGVKRKSAKVLATLLAPRTHHSAKPAGIYNRIEELVDGPYLEMFARSDREGWETWGREASNE